MEHPSIHQADLKKMTIEEIQTKLKDVITKLNFAYTMGNPAVISQLEMIRESYMNAQIESLNASFGGSDDDLDDKIDIS